MSGREAWRCPCPDCAATKFFRVGRYRISATFAWDWEQWLVGGLLDRGVLFTGSHGLMRAVDLDLFALCLHVEIRAAWMHSPYRDGETAMDALFRHSEAEGQP